MKLSGLHKNKWQNYLIKTEELSLDIYNGYRVKSENGVIFRRWSNKILKDYMLKGYAINQRRLDYLEKVVKLMYHKRYFK